MPAVATHETELEIRDPVRAPLLVTGGPSLDEVVRVAWSDLVEEGRADCPVCGGQMLAGSGCQSCGAELF
jgi:hypothetical protein